MNSYPLQFPHGLMFHRVHREGSAPSGQGSVTDAEFENLLHFVGVKNILPPEEWTRRLKKNTLRSKDLCLTFDDGLKCQYEICLPIMEKYGLRGFWFIYSSVLEGKWGTGGKLEIYNCFTTRYFRTTEEFYELFFSRCGPKISKELEGTKFQTYVARTKALFPFYTSGDLKFRFFRNEFFPEFEVLMDQMIKERGVSKDEISKDLWFSNSELKTLSDKGHFIGLHSYGHPFNFSSLSNEDQSHQYRENYRHISEVCKREAVSMAHPLNSYTDNTLELLRELGILCGFRSNTTPPDGKRINPSPLELAREDAANILMKAYASWN